MSDLIDKVHALADGELEGQEKEEAVQAVASDPRAAAEHQWALLLRHHLKEKLPPVANSEAWNLARARLDEIDKARRAENFVGRYAWAFCLIFLVGIFSAATLNRLGPSRPLADSHVANLFDGLTPFKFSEPKDAIDTVRSQVGVAPRQVTGVAVRSLEVGLVDGRRTARMVVDDGHGDMDLFVVAGTSLIEGIAIPDGAYLCGEINGRSAVTWTESGSLFLLVGERDNAELKAVARLMRGR